MQGASMGRFAVTATVACAVLGIAASAAAAAPDELVVRFDPGSSGAERQAAHAKAGLTGRVVDSIPALDADIVRVPPGRAVADAVAGYGHAKGVAAVGQNDELTALAFPDGATAPNDPY